MISYWDGSEYRLFVDSNLNQPDWGPDDKRAKLDDTVIADPLYNWLGKIDSNSTAGALVDGKCLSVICTVEQSINS